MEVCRRGDLGVGGFAFEHDDVVSGVLRHRRVVREILPPVRRGTPMRLQDQVEGESLRRLDGAKLRPIRRAHDALALTHGLDRVEDRAARYGSPEVSRVGKRPRDQGVRHEGPGAVMDQDKVARRNGFMSSTAAAERFEPRPYAVLPRGTPDHGLCQSLHVSRSQGRHYAFEQGTIVRVDDRDDRSDVGAAKKGEERARQQWLASKRPVLLGQAVAGSRAASCGDDEHVTLIRHRERGSSVFPVSRFLPPASNRRHVRVAWGKGTVAQCLRLTKIKAGPPMIRKAAEALFGR